MRKIKNLVFDCDGVLYPISALETKEIIDWLIVNNETYLHDLDPKGDADNALAAFYNRGVPKEDDLKELYKCIGKVKLADRLLEIPVFQTKEQFQDIVSKKISPDEVLLDLKTEKGRNKIVQQYTPLIHKIIRQWIGKSNLGVDDLLSVAYEGITYAMNRFGKRKVRDENGKWVEAEKDEKVTKYSFKQYAAYCIDNAIREEIKHKSHIVRVPASQQTKERKEKGFNTKTYAVSGNKKVGHDSDGNGKSLFDYIDTGENGYKGVDSEDLEKLWKYVYTKLGENFKERDLDIFYSLFGLNGYKQIKGKELAKKYGIVPSAITPIKVKIIRFIRSDKKLYDAFNEILSIVGEAKQDKYNEEDQYLEEHAVKISKNIDDE
jgi:DNA-directed RNA polymerase specialized sigma subunit